VDGDGPSNYSHLRKLTWMKIECHESCHLMPWRLHVSVKTVGALIKA